MLGRFFQHIPSDDEWTILSTYIENAEDPPTRVMGVAGPMREEGNEYWQEGWWTGTNESGFTALPGGYRDIFGVFYFIGYHGYWWSSSDLSSDFAWSRYLLYDTADVGRFSYEKNYGFSVRCVKDE